MPSGLDAFLGFDVSGFYELCVALRKEGDRGLSALYPSSAAVEERPKEMTEYSMGKAAGEILSVALNRSWPGMHIACVRLPRLLTD
jgi:hypothetical protein